MNVYHHSLYRFNLSSENRILEFEWTQKTATMTAEDFQEALHNFCGFALEHRPPGLLVDVQAFRFQMTPQLGQWREEVISPRYVKAGTRRFAYLVPEGSLEGMPQGQAQQSDAPFEERYFESKQNAIEWLTGDDFTSG